MRALRFAGAVIVAVASLTACKTKVIGGTGSLDGGAGGAGGGFDPCPGEGCDPPPPVCPPGESIACYEGPAGTLGVGRCRSGLRTCTADGAGYGPCRGQVVPRAEICGTTSDDDCDGTPTPCAQVPVWITGFENSAQTSQPLRPVLDRNGDLLLAVYFPWPTNESAVIKVDPWGTELARLPLDMFSMRIAASPDGGFVLASDDNNGSTGTLRVRRYDGAWQPVFDRTFPAGPAFVSAMNVDGAGNTVVAGLFNNFVDFGGGFWLGPADSQVLSSFVASFDPSGNVRWAKRVITGSSGEPQGINSVSMDAAGNVVLVGAGSPKAVVDFGTGPVSVASGGYADVLVAKLDPDGAPLWVKRFNGDPMTDNVLGKVDAQGNVVIVGNTGSPLDFGGGPVGAMTGFSAVLDPGGAYVSSFDVDSSGGWINDFAIDPAGNIVIATGTQGTAVQYDIQAHLTRWSPTGVLIASQDFGDVVQQEAKGVVLDAAGVPYFSGYSCGSIDIGTGPLVNTGSPNDCINFLARTLLPW